MMFGIFGKKVGIFVDGPNMLRKEARIDLSLVKQKAKKFGDVVISNVYINQYAKKRLIEAVINQGFNPVVVSGDVDVVMAVDVVFYAITKNLNTVVLVTRDTDFVPAIMRLKELGKKIVIVAKEFGFSSALRHHVDELIFI